jgi:gamma-glutamylcyclotransferase (GGCT)/AIG2-like uncharacterized protein YtfP
MHVFTYGTLMFPEVWQAVVGRPFATIAGHVSGYALYRVRMGVYPGMIETTNGQPVFGIVYLDVDDDTVARLDQFEESFYRRVAMPVACDDGRLREAHSYLVPEENRAELTDEPWTSQAFAESGSLSHFMARYKGFVRAAGKPLQLPDDSESNSA